jgi:hypothetical protein
VPYDLFEAAVAALRAAVPLPGDWHAGPAADGPFPLGRLLEVAEVEAYMTGAPNPTVADGVLQVSVFAADRATARRLADQARAALYDAHLVFAAGQIRALRPAGPRRMIPEPHPAYAGVSLFQAVRDFVYTVDSYD